MPQYPSLYSWLTTIQAAICPSILQCTAPCYGILHYLPIVWSSGLVSSQQRDCKKRPNPCDRIIPPIGLSVLLTRFPFAIFRGTLYDVCMIHSESRGYFLRKKLIRILWSSPLRIDDAIASPITLNCGLYYITRVWGSRETSLYIGKATRTVRERLVSHKLDWLHLDRGGLFVRVGKFMYPRNIDVTIIDHAESALIFDHRDILQENTDKRLSYSYTDIYQIVNTGNIGALHPLVDMYGHPDH